MKDLNIPNLNMKSDKYIFKKKLPLRRKSKKRLIIESVSMFILSILLIYINYLIPNKVLLFKNFNLTINNSFTLIIDLFLNLLQVFLVFMIIGTLLISLVLLIGSFYRIFRILKRKTKQIEFR